MSSRSVASGLFVLCALLLAGLILKPWLASRPARRQNSSLPRLQAVSQAPPIWQPAPRPVRETVLKAIRAQLAAFRADDYARAFQYQSLGLRRNFAGPQAFRSQITNGYPEFAHSRRVQFGPVLADRSAQHAEVVVSVIGANGYQARGLFLMVREGKDYRVGGVAGGGRLPKAGN